MNKKLPNISLSFSQDIQDKIVIAAKQQTKGNKSELIRKLVEKFLVVDEDVIPIFIKVPVNLKGNQQELRKWLDVKIEAIIKTLS